MKIKKLWVVVSAMLLMAGGYFLLKSNDQPSQIEKKGILQTTDKPFLSILNTTASEDKYLLVVLTSPDCSACKAVNRNFEQLSQLMPGFEDNFVAVKLNIQKDKYKVLSQLLYTTGTPTIMVFDPNKKIKYLASGASPGILIDKLGKVINGHLQLPQISTSLYSSGRRLERLINLVFEAWIGLQASDKEPTVILDILKESLRIEKYPMNQYLTCQVYHLLSNEQEEQACREQLDKMLSESDRILYGSLISSIGIQTIDNTDNAVVLTLGESLLDYGELKANELKWYELIAVNQGSKPLVIQHISSSCNCTKVKLPHAPIAPGDTGTIMVGYHSEETGIIQKQLQVYSNAQNSPVNITLRGMVVN